MDFDNILHNIGTFGRWHQIKYLFFIPIFMIVSYHIIGPVLFQSIPHHRCRLSHEGANAKYSLSKAEMDEHYPINNVTKKWDTCNMFEKDNKPKTISCEHYVYDDSKFTETAATLFGMVCGNRYLETNTNSIYMFGFLIGSFASGWLSDKYGRKMTLYLFMITHLLCACIIIFSLNYIMLAFGRFGDGITTAGVNVVAYVLVTELVIPEHRLYAGQMAQLSFSVGYMIAGVHGLFIKHWRYLFGIICAPQIFFLAYWFVIPESPRWLISKNRGDAAMIVITSMAKCNKVDLTARENYISELTLKQSVTSIVSENRTPEATILDIFKHKRLRRNSLLLFFSWFSIAMTYYGITYGTSSLPGDPNILFIVSGVVECIAYIMVVVTVNRWGRKLPYCISMIASGVFLLIYCIIPEGIPNYDWTCSAFALFGKSLICYAYAVAYIYTVELYPTVVRNAGLGTCSTVARLGTILSSPIVLLNVYWPHVSMVIMGSTILVTGFLSVSLPETLNKKLPDTIEEGESFR